LEQRLAAVQPLEPEVVWWRIFEAMSDDPDFEYLIIDSTIVRAHQHASGAKKGDLKIRPLAVRAAA
jgi:putative transposase